MVMVVVVVVTIILGSRCTGTWSSSSTSSSSTSSSCIRIVIQILDDGLTMFGQDDIFGNEQEPSTQGVLT